MTGNNDQKKLKILEAEFWAINQQLFAETELKSELIEADSKLAKVSAKYRDLLGQVPRNLDELANAQSKLGKAQEANDKRGLFFTKKIKRDNIESLKQSVEYLELKTKHSKEAFAAIEEKFSYLKNETDALTYQLNKAQAVDHEALQKRQQEIQKEMNLFTEKDYSKRARTAREDRFLQLRSAHIRGRDDNERE